MEWTEHMWELSALDFGAGLEPLIPRTRITLQMEEGRISGSSGCNRYTGPIDVEADGSVTIGDLAGTMMACPEPVMAQEQTYLRLLRRADRVRMSGGRLEVVIGDDRVLVYERLQASLDGEWVLWGYDNGRQAIVSVQAGTEITARFEGGVMAGTAGCNRYRSSCEVDGEELDLGPLMTTRMACAPEIMEQEARFLGLLERVASYRIDDTGLDLRDGDGRRILRFVRPEPDPDHGMEMG